MIRAVSFIQIVQLASLHDMAITHNAMNMILSRNGPVINAIL